MIARSFFPEHVQTAQRRSLTRGSAAQGLARLWPRGFFAFPAVATIVILCSLPVHKGQAKARPGSWSKKPTTRLVQNASAVGWPLLRLAVHPPELGCRASFSLAIGPSHSADRVCARGIIAIQPPGQGSLALSFAADNCPPA